MKLPAKYDFKCYRGQTWYQILRFRQDEEPMDLTGYTAKAQIRKENNSPILVAEMDTDVLEVEGNVVLALPSERTAKLKPGIYVYDVKMTDANDEVQYYMMGKFIVEGRVTV